MIASMNSPLSSSTLAQALQALGAGRLDQIRRGLEKESLRATLSGALAMTPHPRTLGSALTHPSITTDFSESQLELITAPHANAAECIRELTNTHRFVYRAIGQEMLWVCSMPCDLPADENIPIGSYGSSHVGRAKSVYRMGLGHRYGRRMQTICGIHYNWSLPGLSNEDYFGLIRNFRRHSFVLLMLFGASPAVAASFVAGRNHPLQPLGLDSFFLPHATSLRMGRLGYQSDAQAALNVSYNSLEGYAASLHGALTTPHPPYERIGVRNLGGEYNQLATSLLQIENEFYGTIRPKRTIRSGERPLHALRERGVEYVEVRCLDLDPFEPVGIAASTLQFLDVFLLHCLLSDSAPDTPQETAELARNQQRVASQGREAGLRLERSGQDVRAQDWAAQILQECMPIALALDQAQSGNPHVQALQNATHRLAHMEETPSARALAAMQALPDPSFLRFGIERSVLARTQALQEELSASQMAQWQAQGEASLAEQRRREAADSTDFEAYRVNYLAPEQLLA